MKNFAFFIVALLAPAIAVAVPSGGGPSWESIGLGAVGLIVAMIGAYAKGVADRVSHIEEKIGELNTFILREYHPKADVKAMLDEIKASVQSLHAKFEKFEGLYGR